MLPKKRRIERSLFSFVLAEGKKYHSNSLILNVVVNNKIPTKFSFSVSKKILKKAIDRNKYRRRGYSIINKHIKRVKTGYVCFFVFKKESTTVSFDNLEKEIVYLLTKSSVIL